MCLSAFCIWLFFRSEYLCVWVFVVLLVQPTVYILYVNRVHTCAMCIHIAYIFYCAVLFTVNFLEHFALVWSVHRLVGKKKQYQTTLEILLVLALLFGFVGLSCEVLARRDSDLFRSLCTKKRSPVNIYGICDFCQMIFYTMFCQCSPMQSNFYWISFLLIIVLY